METYKLNNETIDKISEAVEQLYVDANCNKKETYRAKLLIEEALLKYQSRFGEDITVSFRTYRVFSQKRLCVRIESAAFDPFTLEENPMAFMIKTVMSGFEGNMPTWKYANLQNEIVFSVKKTAKLGGLAKIGIISLISVALAFLSRTVFTRDQLYTFSENYLEPLSNAYAGLFCIMAVLLTFFAITLSIVHIGDMASVGAFGGIILRRMYLLSLCAVVILLLPVLPLFKISGLGSVNLAMKSIYDLIIGFIPTNIVTPFLDFNTMHILILGAMFGFSLLIMGQKGEHLVRVFDECNLVAVITNNFINKFIAYYVALKIFAVINMSDLKALAPAGKMIAAILIGEALLFIFALAHVCIKAKIPVGKYLKTTIPTFLVCLPSANFGACFMNLYESEIKLDVDPDTANIATNLGCVVYKPASAVVFLFSSLFFASSYGIKISVVWIITAIIISIILVASMPNIPGASVSALTLLYAQLGLPAKALSLMIAINAALQFVTVAVDTWCLQSECICIDRTRKKKHAEKLAKKSQTN